jgi:hypothetical protein
MAENDDTTRPEDLDSMPTQEGAGEDGLGSKSGGVAGSDERDTSAGGDRPEGDAADGPTKDAESEPGGGDATGPSPSGVPKEGDTDPDADASTGSTEGGPNPAEDD